MLYWICFVLVITQLVLERLKLYRNRAKVPVRIHVHGTRGKSSITRELAAILRSQGLSILAKTTGDSPEYILPDGAIIPVPRVGPARIQEHISMLDKAASMGADAVVVEGIALQPETVYLSETILQASHAVIVNMRPDHAETMGIGRKGVFQTLVHMIPCSGKLFTAEEAGADFLKEEATRKKIDCSVLKALPTRQVTVLAQAVADAVLLKKKLSQPQGPLGFSKLSPPFKTEILGIPVGIYDFLSANDLVSSQLLLEDCSWGENFLRVALIATRGDRPLRTRDFMNWILSDSRFNAVAIMGSHAGYALVHGLLNPNRKKILRAWPWLSPDHLLKTMGKKALNQGKKGMTIVALGNFHGYGEQWRKAVQNPTIFPPVPDQGAKQNLEDKHAD
ncbi:MAG: hypothetical protein HUK40_10400 [Desulfobacter sp.]|nr:hypothetical protein [Desulfobacter sp.]